SKSDVLPKPNARRRCTPAPSSAGLALTSRLMGRMDMSASSSDGYAGRIKLTRPLRQVAWLLHRCALGFAPAPPAAPAEPPGLPPNHDVDSRSRDEQSVRPDRGRPRL